MQYEITLFLDSGDDGHKLTFVSVLSEEVPSTNKRIPIINNSPEKLDTTSTERIPTTTTLDYPIEDVSPDGYIPISQERIPTSKELLSISKEMEIISKIPGPTNSSENLDIDKYFQ